MDENTGRATDSTQHQYHTRRRASLSPPPEPLRFDSVTSTSTCISASVPFVDADATAAAIAAASDIESPLFQPSSATTARAHTNLPPLPPMSLAADAKQSKRKHQKRELQHDGKHEGNTTALVVLFVVCIALVGAVFANFPTMPPDDYAALSFPRSADDLRSLHEILSKYRDNHYWAVYSGFCLVYIFLQMFAIPGAIFLSVLAGPLFGVWTGLVTVSLVATTGSSMCYCLSDLIGRGLVQRCFPALLTKFRAKIRAHRHNLFFYMLFLRLSPLLPNWFISISSPILNVPLSHFFFATLFGMVPANYIHVNTGMTLQSMQSVYGGVNVWSILSLLGLGLLALLPTLFRKKFEEFDEGSAGDDDEQSEESSKRK